jgi:hypothetical protein
MKKIIHCSIFLCTLGLLALPLRCMADPAICHVVDPSGNPVANAAVYTTLDPVFHVADTPLYTDKAGNFKIDDVSKFDFHFCMIDAPGFAPSGGSVNAGENIFTLRLPTKISGKVIDSKGQPAVGVTVCAQSALTSDPAAPNSEPRSISLFMMAPFTSRYTVKTDSIGSYTLDNVPANSQIVVQIKEHGYAAAIATTIPGASEAPPLTATLGTSISGQVVRQDGKPIEVGTQVFTDPMLGDSAHTVIQTAKVSADGSYTIADITPGSYYVDASRPVKKGAPSDWASPIPVKVTATIDIPGVAPDVVLPAGGIITGTVLDADTKKPMADINVSIEDPTIADFMRAAYVKTGQDGKFIARVWIGKVNVNTNSVADGFPSDTYSEQVTVTTVADQTVTLDPILLKHSLVATGVAVAALGGRVDGVVYDGQGKPAAGAWVCSADCEGDAVVVAQADTNGHFELSNLIIGNVTLYSAKGLFFSLSTAAAAVTPDKSSVKLSALPTAPIGSPNLSRVTEMLAQQINSEMAVKPYFSEGEMRDNAAHIIAEASPDAAVNFILSTSSISTWNLGNIVSAKIDSDPVGTASWALLPLKRMSDNIGRGQTAATIGLAVAPYNAVAAAPYYDIAVQFIPLDHFDKSSICDAMRLTTLAYILQKPEADSDYAKILAGLDILLKDSKNDPSMSGLSDWLPGSLAQIIALAGFDKALAMLTLYPSKFPASGSVPGLVAELVKPNPAEAMAAYHWLAKLPDSPNTVAARDAALPLVLPIIFKTDPKAAIAQARAITTADISTRLLTDFADLMPLAQAAPLYKEAENNAPDLFDSGYSPACIASHAWQRDQVLGAKLYKTAYTRFVADTADTQRVPGSGPFYSDFAFYYSRFDPACSRLLLEAHFAKSNQKPNDTYGGDSVNSDAAAMCAIDISRATEMAAAIKDKYRSYNAGLKVAQYLLLTPQQRNAIPFFHWVNYLRWVPGAPSN